MKHKSRLRVLVGEKWPDEVEVIVEKERDLGVWERIALVSAPVLLLLLVVFTIFAMVTRERLLEKVFAVVAVGLVLSWTWMWRSRK